MDKKTIYIVLNNGEGYKYENTTITDVMTTLSLNFINKIVSITAIEEL